MELFYNKHIDSQTKEFILEKDENNHIIKVLRKKQGDIIEFTNTITWLNLGGGFGQGLTSDDFKILKS